MVALLKASLISVEVSNNKVGCHNLISDMSLICISSNMSCIMKGVGTMTYGGESKGNTEREISKLPFTSLKIVRA